LRSIIDMTQPSDLVTLRDEALRKVGRNVVNFQKVEACLKYLIAVSDVQTTKDGLSAKHKKPTATIQRLPLGHLSEAFCQSIYGTESAPFQPDDPSQNCSVSVLSCGDRRSYCEEARAHAPHQLPNAIN
jgi:hypothetical protein